MNKNILQPLILILILLTGAFSAHAARYDTSYVCSGTGVVLTAQNATGYSFHWLSETNAPLPGGTSSTYTVAGGASGATNVPSNTPVRLIYKLVVDSTGGASCSSDTFYKVIYALPSLNVAIDSGSAFYCVGSIPTNITLTSNVTATGTSNAPNLAGLPAYVALTYAWTNTAPSPAGTPGGTPTGQTYTIPGASFITAGPGNYPYTNTVTYNAGTYTLGVGASATGSCAVTKNVAVHVTPQPSVQNLNVTTTFQ